MRRGFIFNHALCVGCKACSAACMLENGWEFHARTIYTHNPGAFSDGAVINISMACNHCKEPVCMLGCPASAYHIDESGAVIPDPHKCIGCRYCIWNCPYDAPKYNASGGVIEKCHFCTHLLSYGGFPACSSACPTGALGFGDIPENIDLHEVALIPEKGINPSYSFTGLIKGNKPEMIPPVSEARPQANVLSAEAIKSNEASLIAFTFLTLLSVSFTVSGFFSISADWHILSLLSILLAGFSAFFHLGSRLRSWRSLSNIRRSPLSMEILAMIIYGAIVVSSRLTDNLIIRIAASITGLFLLLTIDSVYSYSLAVRSRFHSGQVFITSLLVISFLTQQTLPFIFIASVKLLIIFRSHQLTGSGRTLFGLRFIRVAFLIISMIILVSGSAKGELSSLVIFLSGELIDRYLFYFDFDPVNISQTINNTLYPSSDEKENN